MGLTPFARLHLKREYPHSFSFKNPRDATVVVYDLMQDLKFVPEDDTRTLDWTICYFTGKINRFFTERDSPVHTVIVLVDRKPPPVKKMVTHGKRYKGKNVLSAKGGPYLPAHLTQLIPSPWIKFAGNYRNLQRELYPRLFNAFMGPHHLTMRPGQTLILHGFPGVVDEVITYDKHAYMNGSDHRGRVKVVHTWLESSELPLTKQREQEDPDLYNRVFYKKFVHPSETCPQGRMEIAEWEEARNEISESDGAMFFYDHWFQNENIMFYCNDGDVFAYGILYAMERVTPSNVFRNKHYVCMPNKREEGSDLFEDGRPKKEYVDLNMLYVQVLEDPRFQRAQVQNPILTMSFLLVIAGSDFFKDYMKGLGAETILWGVFLSQMSLFSHMVQMSDGLVGNTRRPRTIVLDEECFIQFGYYCYLQKFAPNTRKNNKLGKDDTSNLTLEQLRDTCNNSGRAKKDPDYYLPTQNKFRSWARQILYNLLYYKNIVFGNEYGPDPFEFVKGLPFYPYILNPDTNKPELTNVVSAFTKPIDEVFKHNLWKYRHQKQQQQKTKPTLSLKRERHDDDDDDEGDVRKNIMNEFSPRKKKQQQQQQRKKHEEKEYMVETKY